MPPDNTRSFGGGAATTTLNPLVLVAMVIAVILILVIRRKYVIFPLLFLVFLVPTSEQLYVGGVHLFVSRIIILFGVMRMLVAKFSANTRVITGGFNWVDRAFFWCTICQACAVSVLFLSGNALINQVGFLWDFLGGYFLLRFLIQDEDDIYRAIKCLAFIALICGVCMVEERETSQNVFALIGGATGPDVRDGLARCQGPFAHELMAGAFGATLLPLCILLWKSGKAKATALIGLAGSFLMTWTSNSSTSLLTFLAGIFAVFFWPFRKSMRAVRWGIVVGLFALQLVMKAPIWFLIAHIDLTGGSSSYHRAELIDLFIRHFFDWWLIGIKSSGAWGWDMWDTQNQFVNVGESGGLVAFILFIAMISVCFARLGNARKATEGDPKREWLFWLLGAALFSHVVGFFGVNYFDQTKFVWFLLLAMISAATAPLLQPSTAPKAQAEMVFGKTPLGYLTPSPRGAMTKGNRTTVQFSSRVR